MAWMSCRSKTLPTPRSSYRPVTCGLVLQLLLDAAPRCWPWSRTPDQRASRETHARARARMIWDGDGIQIPQSASTPRRVQPKLRGRQGGQQQSGQVETGRREGVVSRWRGVRAGGDEKETRRRREGETRTSTDRRCVQSGWLYLPVPRKTWHRMATHGTSSFTRLPCSVQQQPSNEPAQAATCALAPNNTDSPRALHRTECTQRRRAGPAHVRAQWELLE